MRLVPAHQKTARQHRSKAPYPQVQGIANTLLCPRHAARKFRFVRSGHKIVRGAIV